MKSRDIEQEPRAEAHRTIEELCLVGLGKLMY